DRASWKRLSAPGGPSHCSRCFDACPHTTETHNRRCDVFRCNVFRLALNLRLFILGWSLAIVFVGSAKAGDPDPNQVPEFALDEKLRAVHSKGSELYNGGDKKGCVKYYVAELTQVHSALGDFPELQNTITKGIKKAGGSATIEDEAFALLDV